MTELTSLWQLQLGAIRGYSICLTYCTFNSRKYVTVTKCLLKWVFLCSPFLCCEEEGLFLDCSCVVVSPSSCARLSSCFISLSYSTHSGTILAAAVSLGSLVFGLLHCSGKKQTKHITHPTSATFFPQVILPFPALSVASIRA